MLLVIFCISIGLDEKLSGGLGSDFGLGFGLGG